jgi:hypothetical protein
MRHSPPGADLASLDDTLSLRDGSFAFSATSVWIQMKVTRIVRRKRTCHTNWETRMSKAQIRKMNRLVAARLLREGLAGRDHLDVAMDNLKGFLRKNAETGASDSDTTNAPQQPSNLKHLREIKGRDGL